MTKEELRHDEFVETTARITAYLQNNFMTVLVGILGVLILIVLGVFFVKSQERTSVQADQAFFRVTGHYAQGAYSEVLTEAQTVMDRFGDRRATGLPRRNVREPDGLEPRREQDGLRRLSDPVHTLEHEEGRTTHLDPASALPRLVVSRSTRHPGG